MQTAKSKFWLALYSVDCEVMSLFMSVDVQISTSCLEMSGKLAILHCHCLCTSNGYLPEQEKMTFEWLKLTAYLNNVFAVSHQNTQG